VLIGTPDCKNLAPIWEDLAKAFSTEEGVLVAKVDAEAENSKAIATEQGVQSYPTIKWFKKGSTEPAPYDGPRTIGDLVDFINTNSGTHRTPAGGLDVTGGTIEALDTIVHKFKGVYSTGADEFKKASEGLQDKYAFYYAKTFDKASKNEGWVEKEFKRLQGLIGKGNLAPQKLDELTSKSNILRKFLGTDDDEEKSEL